MEATKAINPQVRTTITSKRSKASAASSKSFIERMPSEILTKILLYLDVSALFNLGNVNKYLHRIVNDNVLWKGIYTAEFENCKKIKPKCIDKLLKMATVEENDQALGYWKWLYFRTVAAYDMNKWKRQLQHINLYTGLPSQTEKILRGLHITWELTVSDKSGHKGTHELSQALFSETSVTLCWSRGDCLPSYQHISTLQLHAVRKIALNCTGPYKPGLRSLMAEIDVQTFSQSMRVIGQDRLVELWLLKPGIVLGIWKDQGSIAFLMLTLHFHKLVEKCTQGYPCRLLLNSSEVDPTVRPPIDDVDPEYGLHGYQLQLLLHDTVREIVSGSFSQLHCKRVHICDGLIQLTAIRTKDLSQHIPLSGIITLPWSSEVLQGAVQNCCIMNLTLLDEFKTPFWCVSSPVSVTAEDTSVSFDCSGDHFLIHYKDPDGQVEMKLIWMEEQKRFFLVSLVVSVTVCKVNKHFSRNY
ncbi:F-box only protein 15 [Antennarius striatus]|uniref:F-box only protein 15 n=1 Tax=Antennarius striatus TaxID=241820 RepID=UPI0035B21080